MSLQDLYANYHARVQFLVIYIREAHPVDGWWLGGGLPGLMLKAMGSQAATDVYDPTTMEERRVVAGHCETVLRYGIRTYVDEIEDGVNKAYAALPTRLYLIGVDGRIVYAGDWGRLDSSQHNWGEPSRIILHERKPPRLSERNQPGPRRSRFRFDISPSKTH
ncbi:MAG: hypothetical protein HYY30_07485 [Chloroflexi bacterium]|nr:hypothetical protein [Chloroflexota bacterium]